MAADVREALKELHSIREDMRGLADTLNYADGTSAAILSIGASVKTLAWHLAQLLKEQR